MPQGSHSIWAMGVVWGSLGPAGLSLAWAPVSPPGAVGHSGSAHPVPCGSQAGGGMCSVDTESFAVHSLLWSEMKLRNLNNEWLNELQILHFHAVANCCLLLLTLSVQLCRECYF